MTQDRRQLLGLLAGLSLIGSLFAGAARAQTQAAPYVPPPAPATPPPVLGPRVRVTTPKGTFVIEVYPDRAPVTSANFLAYVDQKRYAGAGFYRAMRYPGFPGQGVAQAGLSGLPVGRKLPPIKHEPTTQTGLSHVDGTVSIARNAPGSATSEFFIIVGEVSTALDADPKAPGDNQGFAAFGKVVEGMDVVRAILASPTSATKGEGVMKGQMLEPVIPITAIARVP